jgi:hypothetical protein
MKKLSANAMDIDEDNDEEEEDEVNEIDEDIQMLEI